MHGGVSGQVGVARCPASATSSLCCSDVARVVQAPRFHVNGGDPEACSRGDGLGFECRQAYREDGVSDLVC